MKNYFNVKVEKKSSNTWRFTATVITKTVLSNFYAMKIIVFTTFKWREVRI